MVEGLRFFKSMTISLSCPCHGNKAIEVYLGLGLCSRVLMISENYMVMCLS